MVTTPTPVWPHSRHKMIHTREEVLVWPNSHPRGGGGHIHSSTRQGHSHDDNHRASLYGYINHSWYLSSHHSTKPGRYDGSTRISLQEGMPPAAHDSTDQIKLSESSTKLATTPPYRKTSPKDMSVTMANHSFSPTAATLKRHEPVKMGKHKELLTKVYMKTNGDPHRLSISKDHLKKVKYKSSHMKSSNRSHRKKDTHDVHGNVKFGNLNKTSTPKDQLKMVEYKASHMESLNQFHMKRNTYDVPSSARHPKNIVVLNSAMTKNANTLTTNMMNHNSGSLNKSHQVQEKPHHKQMQKALQYMVKTSSDADANQDPDLAKAEGLNPREGITRHSALPVGTEFLRVLASCSNLIAAGKVLTNQL
jgi:hypothetical protein